MWVAQNADRMWFDLLPSYNVVYMHIVMDVALGKLENWMKRVKCRRQLQASLNKCIYWSHQACRRQDFVFKNKNKTVYVGQCPVPQQSINWVILLKFTFLFQVLIHLSPTYTYHLYCMLHHMHISFILYATAPHAHIIYIVCYSTACPYHLYCMLQHCMHISSILYATAPHAHIIYIVC